MVRQATGKLVYTLDSITRNAPVISGVYALHSPEACLYVAESDDICASLLEHYYVYNPSLNDKEITHFTFELASPEGRRALLIDRIQQLGPTCNQRTEPSRDFRMRDVGSKACYRQCTSEPTGAPGQAYVAVGRGIPT